MSFRNVENLLFSKLMVNKIDGDTDRSYREVDDKCSITNVDNGERTKEEGGVLALER